MIICKKSLMARQGEEGGGGMEELFSSKSPFPYPPAKYGIWLQADSLKMQPRGVARLLAVKWNGGEPELSLFLTLGRTSALYFTMNFCPFFT